MKNLRNKVSLIGRLGADPEVTTLDNGRMLARFTMATNEPYKKKDGTYTYDTQWHTINAWGKVADRVKRILIKGHEIVLEGKLVNQSYETKTGEKRFVTIIEASDILILKAKQTV